jgi:DNA-binding XRE family transcriptional regulator
MDAKKRKRLEDKGWKIGSADEFLGLAPEEAAYIEIRLALAARLRERRQEQHLTQVEMARRIGSSQSRVAKMEAGDPSVSLDLIVRSLLSLGASSEDLASAIRAA